jgi:hypothetical protein
MDAVATPGTPVETYLKKINEVTTKVERSLQKAKNAMKRNWDRNKRPEEEYQEGDLVLVTSHCLPSNRPSRKLDDKWHEPFQVISKKGSAAYELDLPGTWKGYKDFQHLKTQKVQRSIL